MMQLQAYAACDDEVIREHVSAAYEQLGLHIRELTGADEDELNEFLSHGMWLNVQAAIGLADLDDRVRLDPPAARVRGSRRGRPAGAAGAAANPQACAAIGRSRPRCCSSSLNLRLVVAAVPPVLSQIRHATGLSSAGGGLLTACPCSASGSRRWPRHG